MTTKLITTDQINLVINSFYQTNIPAKDFDIIKKFLNTLPDDISEIAVAAAKQVEPKTQP